MTTMAGDAQQRIDAYLAKLRGQLRGFDDAEVKTLGVGKKNGTAAAGWGTVDILIYPPDTDVSTDSRSNTDRR